MLSAAALGLMRLIYLLLADGTVTPSFITNLLLCCAVFAPAALLYLLGLKLLRVRFQ